ncbi:hypothetical protein [Lacisediminimonas sp.]|uniref:hypothetical protein n=1 Tax=Lacisediminimonas sp. TaxID=3060582 RepID=UPI0027251708|nr:hypothetical protein [Lacisediminimonas sp.]MDO8298053.1 hypothetical protein [Lacisediminimonas sp.]
MIPCLNTTAEDEVPFRNVAPFSLSSFVWNPVLGMSFLLVPLYATFLDSSGALLSLGVITPH